MKELQYGPCGFFVERVGRRTVADCVALRATEFLRLKGNT